MFLISRKHNDPGMHWYAGLKIAVYKGLIMPYEKNKKKFENLY